MIAALNERFRGSTHRSLQPPVFRGYWDDGTRLVSDRVMFLFVDVPRDVGDPALMQELEDLRNAACQAYDAAGRHQDAIWLIAHPIVGLVDPCPAPAPPQ